VAQNARRWGVWSVYQYKEHVKVAKEKRELTRKIAHSHVSSDSIWTNEKLGDDKGEVAK
jgi:hypothetical protein